MMRRNFLMIFLLMIMLVGLSLSVVAADTIQLDLKTAVNLALENNLDFQIAKLQLDKSRLEYKKQKASNLLRPSHYNELQAETGLNSAENTYQNTRNQVINNTISQYNNLWLADLDLKIKNKNVELEKMRLEEAQAQYEIGDIGSVDLLDQENAYKDAQFNLENARDEYQQSVKEFISNLAKKNGELKLADLTYEESWQVTEEEAIETALNNSVAMRLTGEKLELARIDLERAGVSAAELDKKIKGKAVAIAELEQEQTREDLITSTQQSYYQFKQAAKKISLTGERLTGAEEKYKLRKEQFGAGLITRIEVLEYEVNMLQARYNHLVAIADYYLKEQALRQKMGLKSGVLVDETTENEQ